MRSSLNTRKHSKVDISIQLINEVSGEYIERGCDQPIQQARERRRQTQKEGEREKDEERERAREKRDEEMTTD